MMNRVHMQEIRTGLARVNGRAIVLQVGCMGEADGVASDDSTALNRQFLHYSPILPFVSYGKCEFQIRKRSSITLALDIVVVRGRWSTFILFTCPATEQHKPWPVAPNVDEEPWPTATQGVHSHALDRKAERELRKCNREAPFYV